VENFRFQCLPDFWAAVRPLCCGACSITVLVSLDDGGLLKQPNAACAKGQQGGCSFSDGIPVGEVGIVGVDII